MPRIKTKVRTTKAVEEKHIGSEPKPGATLLTNLEIIHALNHYNYFYTRKEAVEFLHSYLAKSDPLLLKSIKRIDDNKIPTTLGWVARMLDRGCTLSESSMHFWDKNLIDIQRFIPPVAERKPRATKPVSTNNHLPFLADLEIEVDNFLFRNNFKSTFTFNEWAQKVQLTAAIAQAIREFYAPLLEELESITKDKQVREGYSNMTAAHRKAYIAFIQMFVAGCDTILQNKKQVRRPRKKRAPKIENIIKGLKYQEHDTTLNIQSIHPSKLIGAEQLVTFNTKTRKLSIYFALPSQKFSLKGSTLMDVDLEKSYEKTLRKPHDTIPLLMKNGKRSIKTIMDALSTTQGKIDTGRINKNHILLMAF